MSSISFAKAIEIALEQHKAGKFERAETLYMEILRQDPGNIDALQLLGVLAHQGKKPELAVQLIGAAISRKDDVPVFHFNLAEALTALDRREDAISSYNRAIELAPEYFEAHNNLGNVLNQLRRYAEAETACRTSIELNDAAPLPFNNLGNALRGLKRGPEALEAFDQAIKLKPDFVDAMNNRAMCLCWMNRLEDGIEQFKAAIQVNPTLADVHNNMGMAYTFLGRHEEAGGCYQTAIDLKPDHAEATNNLGVSVRSLGRLSDAVELFEKAVELKPDFVEAYSSLATALSDLGRKEEALKAIDTALELRPLLSKEHMIRGLILRDLRRMDEGVDTLRKALELDPGNVGAITTLGYALLEQGDLEEAMECLQRSIELNPDPQTHSNVLMAINYHPGYSPADLLAAHRRFAELHEKPHIASWKPLTNDRSPDRKLRVGYVSPDFRGHSVSYFLEPILQHHDHENFEIYAYAHMSSTDMHTWRLRAQIDQWRETSNRTPDDVARMIREDQIDILVELAGHTANNAMTTFARKPAPVQINMIGFPSTTGLSSMDYRITDELCDPPGLTDPYNTESLIRMPGLFWCYQPPAAVPDIGPLPANENGIVTFTSVNNFTKVTPDVQRMWAELLRAVPNSKLILQTTALASEKTQASVTARFAEHGIRADRLTFNIWSDFPQYMKLLERSDMTLDPYPFNGGTTTCHSLWMGAPVITLAGDRHASRMGLSMMTAIGLPEFVAHTPDEYVQIAVRFANDLPRLGEIRAGMRERLKTSPLLDAVGYTRNLEAAYHQVWRKWCETASMEVK